jgi:hypothetical protein
MKDLYLVVRDSCDPIRDTTLSVRYTRDEGELMQFKKNGWDCYRMTNMEKISEIEVRIKSEAVE